MSSQTKLEGFAQSPDASPRRPNELALYALTSAQKINGASVIAGEGVLQAVADYLGDSFYLMPSSIHPRAHGPPRPRGWRTPQRSRTIWPMETLPEWN